MRSLRHSWFAVRVATIAAAAAAAGCREVPHMVGDWSFGGDGVVRFTPEGSVAVRRSADGPFMPRVEVAMECEASVGPGDPSKPNTAASCGERSHWTRKQDGYRWTQARLVYERRTGLSGLLMAGPPCSCRVETKFVDIDQSGEMLVRDEKDGAVSARGQRVK